MKNKLFLSTIRTIRNTKKKFFSLLCLSLLGVGFFVGIKATSPDMIKTLDTYLDEASFYDIEIVSTLGLTEQDRKAIEDLEIADKIIGSKYLDKMVEIDGNEKIVRVLSINDINKIKIVEGTAPKSRNEIVVEKAFLENHKLKLRDTITIPDKEFSNTTFKIVGVVESPLYFSGNRGTTNIGNGALDYYFYALDELFSFANYTSIYIRLKDTENLTTNSTLYLKKVEEGKEKLKTIQKAREAARYEELYRDTMISLETKEAGFVKSVWHIFDRTDNQGYAAFIDASFNIGKIVTVFPLEFFVVAILISLISMSRMVEEERLDIGTLKGLGFSNIHIYLKHFFYAFLATTIGGILGMLIGFRLFPTIVWDIYTSMFQIPFFICEFHLGYAMIGYSISAFCICGASIVTSFFILREKPSNLMRPKAPRIGKKIFLERFPIWTKLPFSIKISIRNLFRYKKRILVTIIGIAGSTALLLVGFGVKDAVADVVNLHYNHVFTYDRMIFLKTGTNQDTLLELLQGNAEIDAIVEGHYEVLEFYNGKKESLEVQLIAPKDDLKPAIRLNDGKEVTLKNDEIVVSEKLAKLLNIKVGDMGSFLIHGEYKKIRVSHIVENYVNHYVYLTRETYQKLFGTYDTNVIFIKNNMDYNKKFDREIMKQESVSYIIAKETSTGILEDTLNSLNSVVIILIISSAMLAFVILYNLSSINISERKREISTLKVLGFYDEEVDAYITNENYFITIVGIALGLFGGLYLCHYVISTCEPDFLMFVRHIKPLSYVISVFIAILFTIIVSKITHFNLKKIDMVESLKSNE